MTATPWGSSCKGVHDWECLLVKGGLHISTRDFMGDCVCCGESSLCSAHTACLP